jgi:hypothetical protein
VGPRGLPKPHRFSIESFGFANAYDCKDARERVSVSA